MEDIEKDAILRTLQQTGGNRTRAAEILGIGLRTLQRKLREYEQSPGTGDGLPQARGEFHRFPHGARGKGRAGMPVLQSSAWLGVGQVFQDIGGVALGFDDRPDR